MNVITGLPRSGSTLLCNILNQNPDYYASSTSVLAGGIQGLTKGISEQLESQELDYEKLRTSVKAFIKAWYPDKTVFDKGRLWSQMGLVYQDLQLGKMYVMVRDLRDVYASCEKQHRKNPMLHSSNIISSTGVYERAEMMFSDTGMIGGAVLGVEDLIRRSLDNVVFIQYEALVTEPEKIMKQFDSYQYNFTDVQNVSEENDKMYHNKYPHNGSGAVTARSIGSWRNIIDKDLAKTIQNRFPLYNEVFGY